jgi:hypothetical protein
MTMARKRKVKKEIPITEFYEIEVEDWEANYRFGPAPKNFIDGQYWEFSELILVGRIISPVLEKTSKARIIIQGDPKLDDHWRPEPTIISARAIGYMVIPRGDERLEFFCRVPSRSLPYIAIAVQSGKIKYASMAGTKLKWKQGTISRICLSTQREEE